jgi:hypothetical protein
LPFKLLRFCCISHAKCTCELDFGFCCLLYVDGPFFCFEDASSLCGLCSLWVLSCSGVSPRFNAVVDVDMGILYGSGFPGHVVPEWELLLLGLKSKAKLFCVSACELREILSPGVSDYMLFISLVGTRDSRTQSARACKPALLHLALRTWVSGPRYLAFRT